MKLVPVTDQQLYEIAFPFRFVKFYNYRASCGLVDGRRLRRERRRQKLRERKK